MNSAALHDIVSDWPSICEEIQTHIYDACVCILIEPIFNYIFHDHE